MCLEDRLMYMENQQSTVLGKEHQIDRSNVYEDVLNLYKANEIINECPILSIFIKYVGEKAVDDGGVQRDMLSSFWEQTYRKLFEGATLLTPMVHPQIDRKIFPVIGRILSHGYLVAGILPVRIALPTLICMLLGPSTEVSKDILLDTFLDFISSEEKKTMKQALKYKGRDAFPHDVQENLERTLANFDFHTLPRPDTLMQTIEDAAHYEFIHKPAAAIGLINSGIPVSHKEFWNKKSSEEIVEIYKHLTLTPSKMIQLFNFPDAHSPQQERVSSYLRTMIGNLGINYIDIVTCLSLYGATFRTTVLESVLGNSSSFGGTKPCKWAGAH